MTIISSLFYLLTALSVKVQGAVWNWWAWAFEFHFCFGSFLFTRPLLHSVVARLEQPSLFLVRGLSPATVPTSKHLGYYEVNDSLLNGLLWSENLYFERQNAFLMMNSGWILVNLSAKIHLLPQITQRNAG
jgi:hypothetical protein